MTQFNRRKFLEGRAGAAAGAALGAGARCSRLRCTRRR